VGLFLVMLGLALGVVDTPYGLMFVAVVYGYGTVVTMVALAVEEVIFHKYDRWRDLGGIVLASVVENFGYRQVTAWWRMQGLWAALRGKKQARGTRAREGFVDDVTAVTAVPGDMAVTAPSRDG